ncbi:MAG: hypothetical protein MMC33_005796 [Icmadophila ericetorum]|nr:hypothetical protein [Icmadophila ericetorum]
MSIGDLARLPLEVRRLIWRYFVLPCTPLENGIGINLDSPLEQRTDARRLAIIETNKQIHDEVMTEIEHERRDNEVFLHLCGKQECITGGIIRDLPHLELAEFAHTDFSQFKKVSINLFAPEHTDPGQFLRLRSMLHDVIVLLGPRIVNSPLVMEVVFRGDGWKSWYSPELALKEYDDDIVICRDPHWSSCEFSKKSCGTVMRVLGCYINVDIVELLLTLLQTLNHSGMEIQLPSREAVSNRASEIAVILSRPQKTTTGSDRGDYFEGDFDDDYADEPTYIGILDRVEIFSMFFECVLDQLRGPTAAMVRRERFRKWNWTDFKSDMEDRLNRAALAGEVGNTVALAVTSHLAGLQRDYAALTVWPERACGTEEVAERIEAGYRASVDCDGVPAKHTREWYHLVKHTKHGKCWETYTDGFLNGISSEEEVTNYSPYRHTISNCLLLM